MTAEHESTEKTLTPDDLRSYSEAVAIGQLVEMMMQSQKAIGELTSDVKNINSGMDDHNRKLDRVNDKIDRINYAIVSIGAFPIIVTAIGGFCWIHFGAIFGK